MYVFVAVFIAPHYVPRFLRNKNPIRLGPLHGSGVWLATLDETVGRHGTDPSPG